jgi:hypothetical protein
MKCSIYLAAIVSAASASIRSDAPRVEQVSEQIGACLAEGGSSNDPPAVRSNPCMACQLAKRPCNCRR